MARRDGHSQFGASLQRNVEHRHFGWRAQWGMCVTEAPQGHAHFGARPLRNRHVLRFEGQCEGRDTLPLAGQIDEDLQRVNGLTGVGRNFLVDDAAPGRRPVQATGPYQVASESRLLMPVFESRNR